MLFLATLGLVIAAPANAAIISFGALSGPNLAPFSSVTESGFTIRSLPGSVAGSVNQQTGLGSLGTPPYLDFYGFGGTIEITRTNNGIFHLNSFDFLGITIANRNMASYTVTQYQGVLLQGSETGAPVFSNVWSTIQNSNLNLINRLTIQISDDNLYDGVSFLGSIDNIDVVEHDPVSSVPEPAAWAMMIAGFGAIGSMLRRRRKFAPHMA